MIFLKQGKPAESKILGDTLMITSDNPASKIRFNIMLWEYNRIRGDVAVLWKRSSVWPVEMVLIITKTLRPVLGMRAQRDSLQKKVLRRGVIRSFPKVTRWVSCRQVICLCLNKFPYLVSLDSSKTALVQINKLVHSGTNEQEVAHSGPVSFPPPYFYKKHPQKCLSPSWVH